MRSLKTFAINIGVLSAAVVGGLVLVEVILRLFFPVTDIGYFAYDPKVGLHLEPNQKGVEITGAFAEGRGEFRVNADGWNSIHDYDREKADGALRLAVIGDSFVENMFVNTDQMFSALAEGRLRQEPQCQIFSEIEAYNFGVGGVPMSHYADLMRYADQRYAPDGFVVLIYPGNDFSPSLLPPNTQSSLPYTVYEETAEGGFSRVDHVPFQPSPLRRALSKLAAVRYLYGNLDLRSLPALRKLGLAHDPQTAVYQVPHETMNAFTDFIVGEYKKIAAGRPLLVLIDADRHAIYGEPERVNHGRYVGYVLDAASRHQIDHQPLEPIFRADFEQSGKRFDFPSDEHWNLHANHVVSDVLATWTKDTFCEGLEAVSEVVK